MKFFQNIMSFFIVRKRRNKRPITTNRMVAYEEKIDESVLDGLNHAETERYCYPLLLNFADADEVPVSSMHVSETYEEFLEGRPSLINARVFIEEKYKSACAGDGYHFVTPILYGTEFGWWRIELTINYWAKSSPEKEYAYQLYTLTIVLFTNKISDDQVPLSQHLSQYTHKLKFFDLAHKCTDGEMDF